jgi:acetyl esterase/lipase
MITHVLMTLVTLALLAFGAGASLVAQGRTALDLAMATVPGSGERVAYGKDPLEFGELRLPSGKGPYPVAIVIHGGCWLSQVGTLDPRAVSYENMRPLAAALNAAGIATWNVEYRRLGHPGGGWPGTFQDVAHAADAVRALAKSHPLDLSRVVTIGHSAGGHFATWVAARHRLTPASELYVANPIHLKGVVSLDGPADLKKTIAIQRPICGKPVITDLIGGSPEEQPARFHDGSPIELLPLGVRQVFFTGRMFDGHAAPYQQAARVAGDEVDLKVYPDADHIAFIDPQSALWAEILRSTRALLDR